MRPTIVHITSAPGGGVDRHIRDIAASVPGPHWVWHLSSEVDVLEDVHAGRFWPLRPAHRAVADWLVHAGVALVHLHGVDRGCRDRLDALRFAGPVPFVATLHDLGFAHPQPCGHPGAPPPAPAWSAEVAAALQHAGRVIAPSAYLRDEALRLMPGLPIGVLPPGIQRPAPTTTAVPPDDFLAHAPQHVVAVVGAIGPHKGSALLAPLAQQLGAADAAIVVIGYTDQRLAQGWERGWKTETPGRETERPGRLYIHGPYIDDDLPRWLAAYAPSLVLFPNRLPESFSYTLSEVWAAGLPVIVPDTGALGERVRRWGGGWLLPQGFSADDAARLIVHLLSPAGRTEWGRVKSAVVPSDPARVPPLAAMSAALAEVYAQVAQIAPFGGSAPDVSAGQVDAIDTGALQHLLAANLNGFTFRRELVHLCEALLVERAHQAAGQQWAAKLQQDVDSTQAWATKVEGDVAALTAELTRRDEAVNALNDEVHRLTLEMQRLAADKVAFDQLPSPLRRMLLRKAMRGRG